MIARAIIFSAAAMLATATAALADTANHTQPWQQEGTASWYGADHAGKRTTSGEIFDPARLTAAHATLPLGTRLLVVRQDTGASVVVTINDRIGTHRRVIDLSRGAADALGFLRTGLAQVRLVAETSGTFIPAPAFATPSTDGRTLGPVVSTDRSHGRRYGGHAHLAGRARHRGHLVFVATRHRITHGTTHPRPRFSS